MRKHTRAGGVLIALLAIGAALPAVVWAGQKVVSGQQSLQIKVTVTPARAGAKGGSMRFHSEYLSTKPGGQQPPYNTKSTIVTGPKGLTINASAAPSCFESKVLKAKGNAPSVCPASAKVGHGAVVVNARPSIKSLITGTVVVYNGIDDGGYGGYRRGSRELILYVSTSVGIKLANFLHIVNTAAGNLKLAGTAAKPAKPGVTPGSYSLQKLDLTVSGSGKKPYLIAPPTCKGSWPFSLTITNWFGQPTVTARDSVKCTK